MIARGQQPLPLEPAEPERTETGRVPGRPRHGRRRDLVLFVHLCEDALRSGDPAAPAHLDNAGGQLLTAAQVAEWCGRADTSRVIVKPVIDLNTRLHTDAYQIPARIAEQVELRDRTCVFPWCHKPARSCDKDHVIPYDQGGATASDNLAPLCRRHHRVKTHGDWSYTVLEPGTYLWSSPHGYAWLRDRSGTTDLTQLDGPPPVDPPPRRTS